MNFGEVKIFDEKNFKVCVSDNYNYLFNKNTGLFIRYGKDKNDDPQYAPAPEILDIEVTTICNGIGTNNKVCKFCYKSNGPKGENMSFDTFKAILDKFPINLTQIAFGADSRATSNKDLFKMMDYAREKGIIPNITVAEISDEIADKLVKVVGAVAVSRYEDKNICYDSVKKLTDRGLSQTNIHIMVSKETKSQVMETLNDSMNDPRLNGLNAIVLLSLKKKGRGESYNQLTENEFKEIVDFALDNKIRIGFDSCSAFKFLTSVSSHENFDNFLTACDPCESTLFSSYVDVSGKFYPCSFSEGIEGWEDGIDVKSCEDFVKDIWFNKRTVSFRNNLISSSCNNSLNCRECPIYKI